MQRREEYELLKEAYKAKVERARRKGGGGPELGWPRYNFRVKTPEFMPRSDGIKGKILKANRNDRWLTLEANTDYLPEKWRQPKATRPQPPKKPPPGPPRTPSPIDWQLEYDRLRRIGKIFDRHIPSKKHDDCFCRDSPIVTPPETPRKMAPDRSLGAIWPGYWTGGLGENLGGTGHCGCHANGFVSAAFPCKHHLPHPDSPPPRRNPLQMRGPLVYSLPEIESGILMAPKVAPKF